MTYIVSRTDSLAGPGRPCLLSPVNGRHLQQRLPYLAGTSIPGVVLGYLTGEEAHRGGGTILSNLGKLSPRSIGQWLSEREPRSRSLGTCIPAPSRQPKERIVQSRAGQTTYCANSAEIRNQALTTTILWYPSCPHCKKHRRALHPPSVLAAQVHHVRSRIRQIDRQHQSYVVCVSW